MKDNWKQITKFYNDPSSHMLRNAVGFAGSISDGKTRDEFREFFSKKENIREEIGKAVPKALEAMDANIKFMELNRGQRHEPEEEVE